MNLVFLKTNLLFLSLVAISASSCMQEPDFKQPNIILIMADDMGYECLGTYGSAIYKTPFLDKLAEKGMKFNSCVSQPLCTPSRVKIMTGMYNYRNYDRFGYLDVDEYSFGNLMQDAGYSTCIAGKWQLNGLAYKEAVLDWNDSSKPTKLGFDEYSLWQLTQTARLGGRYADPLIEQNGELLEREKTAYGPDIFADYVVDFIERKKDSSFFVYYPMVLVHDPFVPTPDSQEWQDTLTRTKKDTSYFKDMVAYTDKIVGNIQAKLEELGIADNTILIFTGDNGTHPTIHTLTNNGVIQGAKGNTIDAGTHVPLIVSWPEKMKEGKTYEGLIEFSDFFATFADLVGSDANSDGKSFLPLLRGEDHEHRKTAFVHYDPQWGKNVNRYRNQFVRNLDHKLYQDGGFFDLRNDALEKSPLLDDLIPPAEEKIRTVLQEELNKHPEMREIDEN